MMILISFYWFAFESYSVDWYWFIIKIIFTKISSVIIKRWEEMLSIQISEGEKKNLSIYLHYWPLFFFYHDEHFVYIEKRGIAYCLAEMMLNNIKSHLNSATIFPLIVINVIFNNNGRRVFSSTKHFHMQHFSESL